MWIVKILYAPFMLLGFNGAAIWLISNGAPHWTLAPLFVAALWSSFTLERWAPYVIDWNRPHNDKARDVAHFVVNESANVTSVLSLPVIAAIIPWSGIWPHHWPLWGQVLLAVIVADFGVTLAHYYSHKYRLLWRFHAVHHSVKRMYGFNGLMKHPFHQAFELVAGVTPLVLAGMPLDVAFLLGFAIAIQLLLQHSNVDMRIGTFKYFLALAPVHRFHHLKEAGDGDVNFGLFTTIWDRMLGTAYYDRDKRFSSDELGIGAQPDYPTGYLRQLIQPFLRQP
ncbi:sterol desaturase family protein [Marinicaulis aureus]|uniref:Sterol desaturase family protein n=1 Tax=Hyphococcus aureus TaxID=2666033 RepID=A0ABW1L171_9PROT